ncbi:MAG: KH domain-containing protein [Elusimicrobiota bacterium]|nr:KH domain-containing protein [Endomicrobiia bacterium]MCX7910962.1 KH domain-containing protein [Endomicrobiia bacterium]MDW8166291.1 KH domain-containing protein [Elusimicrobiota bacterium]
MKELLATIVKALVDYPDKVEVKEIGGEQSVILELKVAETDRGKVIGKQGRIIRAIRTIVGCSAAKLNKRVVIEVIEK